MVTLYIPLALGCLYSPTFVAMMHCETNTVVVCPAYNRTVGLDMHMLMHHEIDNIPDQLDELQRSEVTNLLDATTFYPCLIQHGYVS